MPQNPKSDSKRSLIIQLGRFSWIGALVIIAVQGGYYLLITGRKNLEERELTTIEIVMMLLGLVFIISGLVFANKLANMDKKAAEDASEEESNAEENRN